MRVAEHVFGEHRVGVDDDARMIGVDSGVEQRNQIFGNVIVLAVVTVVAVFLVAREQVVDGKVDVQVGPLQLADDQGAGSSLQNALSLKWKK